MALDSEDKEILSYARDLCRQLGIYRDLQTVIWTDRIEFYRTPPDYVLIYQNELVMPIHFIGSLTTEELKPLVASALMYRKILNGRFLRGLMKTIVPAFLVMYFGLYALGHLFSDGSAVSQTILSITLFVSMGLFAFAFFSLFRITKRIYLEADKLAAQLVGTATFLNVLEKMRSLGVPNTPPMASRPKIWERIINLQRNPSPVTRGLPAS